MFIGLALALVLVALAPAETLAKKEPKADPSHFAAIMTPTAIDDTVVGTSWPVRDTPATNVWPIYDEGALIGWLIDGRAISGDVTDGFEGSFTFTYGGILDTLQSGSIQGMLALETNDGVIYMAASGTLQAEVIEVYSFEELVDLCGAALPTVFSLIYDNEDLASVPATVLEGWYGVVLPPLPKTLTAELKGKVEIEAGTGAYSGVRGKGEFNTDKKEPLILHVTPAQHVSMIEGSIELEGKYDKKSLPDKGKWGKEDKPE